MNTKTNTKFIFLPLENEGKNKNSEIYKETTKNITDDYLMDIIKMNELIKDTTLGERFELQESIKRGSEGVVYKGKIKGVNINKNVALKFLISEKIKEYEKKKINKKKKRKKKHLEISIHGKLKHKNLTQVYGYYKVKDYYCIVMDYIKFDNIEVFKKNNLKRALLSETFICYIAIQILDAILYLHRNKIIHMDIKQQNILIDDFLNIKLTDFSVSIDYKDLKKIQLNSVGTCYYISPEALEGKIIDADDASKIDIYSFGVLLYVLAFCDYPYELKSVDNTDFYLILKNIKEKVLTFPENTRHSSMFKNFLIKCLDKNINKRYNIYEAIKDPWVQGYKYILDEKEKLYNAGKFLTNIMVDNIRNFNIYRQ